MDAVQNKDWHKPLLLFCLSRGGFIGSESSYWHAYVRHLYSDLAVRARVNSATVTEACGWISHLWCWTIGGLRSKKSLSSANSEAMTPWGWRSVAPTIKSWCLGSGCPAVLKDLLEEAQPHPDPSGRRGATSSQQLPAKPPGCWFDWRRRRCWWSYTRLTACTHLRLWPRGFCLRVGVALCVSVCSLPFFLISYNTHIHTVSLLACVNHQSRLACRSTQLHTQARLRRHKIQSPCLPRSTLLLFFFPLFVAITKGRGLQWSIPSRCTTVP